MGIEAVEAKVFGISQFRLIGYGLIAAAIGFLVMREHWAVQRAKAQTARAQQAETALEQEIANRQKEHDLYATIDKQLAQARSDLDAERNKPLPHLSCRLSNRPTNLPSSNTAAPVDSGTSQGHDGQADAGDLGTEFDPSEQLLSFAVDAQENKAELEACQSFVRQTH